MSTEGVADSSHGAPLAVPDKGLKHNAIGYVSNVVIGVASTAPAYSLAATLGFIVAINGVGLSAPGVLIASFVPMFLIAGAYRALNRVEPDAGTSFAWATRALGPHIGWLNGWAIFVADVLVMASLSQIAATYTFLLFEWDSAVSSNLAIIIGSVVWILLMTFIAYRGIELSARVQMGLLSAEVLILGVFAIVALVKVYTGDPTGSVHPELDWFNPFSAGTGPLLDGILLGVFIYWGWDSGVTVNEESRDSAQGPGKAAILSTVLLLLIYIVVGAASQSYAGAGFLTDNADDVLSALGSPVLGSGLDKVLIFAVLTSAAASTQTTILPTARTTISMAVWRAVPQAFAKVHDRYRTPSFSTLFMGAVSVLWTIFLLAVSPNQTALADSIAGIGFPICFYYGFTGIACVVFYRRELARSLRLSFRGESGRGKHFWRFIQFGVGPLLGSLILFIVLIKAFDYYSQTDNVSSSPVLGVTLPLVMGIGGLILGALFMIISIPKFRSFFARKPEVAPEGSIDLPL